jgi:hypothetical protein
MSVRKHLTNTITTHEAHTALMKSVFKAKIRGALGEVFLSENSVT